MFAPKQGTAPEGTSGEVNGKLAYMAVVKNGSHRPIREVTCRLSPLAGRDYDAQLPRVAELTPLLPVSDVMQLPFSAHPQNADRVAMIRADQCFEFRFAVPGQSVSRREDQAALHR